ncbi:MAG: hypothetical protein ACR2RB_14590, partial [Gammaproteobacteria bacterium]
SALACAHCRGGAIAIDDKVAIKRANDMFVEMSILRTLDLMVLSTPKWKRVRLDQFISPRRTRRRCRESPAQLHELVYEEPYSECSGFNLAARSQPTKGCRCVDSRKQGNGKKKGEGNRKNGNRYLAWAYIEAANFAVGHNAKAKRFYARKKAKTNNIVVHKALAHKLARAG